MIVICSVCKKERQRPSKGVADRLRDKRFCSKECFNLRPRKWISARKTPVTKKIYNQDAANNRIFMEIETIETSNRLRREYDYL